MIRQHFYLPLWWASGPCQNCNPKSCKLQIVMGTLLRRVPAQSKESRRVACQINALSMEEFPQIVPPLAAGGRLPLTKSQVPPRRARWWSLLCSWSSGSGLVKGGAADCWSSTRQCRCGGGQSGYRGCLPFGDCRTIWLNKNVHKTPTSSELSKMSPGKWPLPFVCYFLFCVWGGTLAPNWFTFKNRVLCTCATTNDRPPWRGRTLGFGRGLPPN